MRRMTAAEYRAFLLERPRTLKLATMRADGRPHIAPVWFDLDGDCVVFTTWHTTVKAANLRREPRVAMCVDDDVPPFSLVILEGVVTISENDPGLLHWATRIAGRYMGPELAVQYGQRNGVPGELLVRVVISRVVAQADIAE